MQDLINFLFLIFSIFTSSVLIHLLRERRTISEENSDDLLFLLLSFLAVFSLVLLRSLPFLFSIGGAMLFFSYLGSIEVLPSVFPSRKENCKRIFALSVSFLLVLILFPRNRIYLLISITSFATAEFLLSSLFGKYRGKKKKDFYNGTNLWFSFIFGILTFALLYFLTTKNSLAFWNLPFGGKYSEAQRFATVGIAAFLMTIFENFSSKSAGAFLSVFFTSYLLFVFLEHGSIVLLINFSFGFLLAFVVAYLSYRVKFLTRSGAVATFVLAGFIFGFGGWKWSVPILAFFILSSILSKVRKKKNAEVELFFEKTGVRDHWQVIANGGLGGVLILLNQIHPDPVYYYAYLASLAAVCADTWATEIGTMFPAPTYFILNFKRIEQGVSGGVSLRGSLGALAGAIVIAFSGMCWVKADFNYFLLVVGAGFFGSVFDSYLGATLQLQNRCTVCGKITEREVHCNTTTEYHKGIKWLNNDAVNLLAGIFGIFMIFLFYYI